MTSKHSYLRIRDTRNLVKDPTTKAILEIDGEALRAYRNRRNQQENIQSALEDLDTLKQEFTEIKSLIGEVLALVKKGS